MKYIPVQDLTPGMTFVGTDRRHYPVLEVKVVTTNNRFTEPTHVMVLFDASDVEATGGSFRSWKVDHEVLVLDED